MIKKFRVWSVEENKFLWSYADSGTRFYRAIEQKFVDIGWFLDCERLENPTRFFVQQYTGLVDKNEDEIYEGDILKSVIDGQIMTVKYGWYRQFEEVELANGNLHAFNYSHVGFFVEWKEGEDEFETTLAITNSNSRVIGNIFENKDLLK